MLANQRAGAFLCRCLIVVKQLFVFVKSVPEKKNKNKPPSSRSCPCGIIHRCPPLAFKLIKSNTQTYTHAACLSSNHSPVYLPGDRPSPLLPVSSTITQTTSARFILTIMSSTSALAVLWRLFLLFFFCPICPQETLFCFRFVWCSEKAKQNQKKDTKQSVSTSKLQRAAWK